MNDRIVDFLNKIKMIESSDGIDTDHPKIQEGIHKGQSAIGSYGLMPNTVQELLNRRRLKQGKFIVPEFKDMYKEDPNYIKAVLNARPDLEEKLAKQLAERVLRKSQGDEELAAYQWNMGHNLPVSDITPEKLDESKYIKKFRILKEKLGLGK